MKKFVFLFSLVFLVACGDSYDKDGFAIVTDYAEEAIEAIDSTILEIVAQAENEELNEEALAYAERLRSINDRYWEKGKLGDVYGDEEISSWDIKMSRGNQEWHVDGDELSEAIYNVEADVDFLANEIESVYEEPTEDNVSRLATAIEYARESSDELRMVLYNQ